MSWPPLSPGTAANLTSCFACPWTGAGRFANTKIVARTTAAMKVACLLMNLLRHKPGSWSADENVGRTGASDRLVGLVAVDALGAAIFAACSHDHNSAVPTQRNRASELVTGSGVRSLDIGLLGPGSAAASEIINCAGLRCRGICLVAVDAFRRAVFVLGAHSQCIAVAADVEADSEPVLSVRVRRLDEGLLGPSPAVSNEDVRSTGRGIKLLVVVAARGIDPWGQAVFVGSARCDGIAVIADGERVSQ